MITRVFYHRPSMADEVGLDVPHDSILQNIPVSTFIHDCFHRGYDVMLTHCSDGESMLIMVDEKGRKFRQR